MPDMNYSSGVKYLWDSISSIIETHSNFDHIDFSKYYKTMSDEQIKKITDSFQNVTHRVPEEIRNKIYNTQILYYILARLLLPGVSQLLPEIIHDDWLSALSYQTQTRDHLIHQPMVAHISDVLLNLTIGGKKDYTIIKWIVDQIMGQSEDLEYLRYFINEEGGIDPTQPDSEDYLSHYIKNSLLIASLYHDIGYPWQFVYRLTKNLKHNSNHLRLMDFDAESFITEYQHRMLFLPLQNYSRNNHIMKNDTIKLIGKIAQRTHSMYSALCLLRIKDDMSTFPVQASLYNLSVESAATAIFVHDLGKVYRNDDSFKPEYPSLRVQMSKDPISAILVLADYLQEFSRYRTEFWQADRKDSVNVKFNLDCDSCKIKIVNSVLHLTFHYKRKDPLTVIRAQIEKERLFNRYTGFLDLSAIGIDQVVVDCK